MRGRFALAALVQLLIGAGSPCQADVKLSRVLSSHMVLQRDMPVPIWGTAAAICELR